MELFLTRTLSGFSPADDESRDGCKKFKVGETFRATVVKPRELRNHRRYWKLVSVVTQNTDMFKTTEQCHQYLKLRSGHCSPIANKATGEIFLIPESISFSNMDETEFQEFWRNIVKVVCEEVIPGLSEDSLVLEVEKLLGLAA